MNIRKATSLYEAWLRRHLSILPSDIKLKHEHMRQALFPFLRATYYRWAQCFPETCPALCEAPTVLAVGDLHVENFGTWRDAEGRLVWGINDFDEAWRLPYTHDLVRLTTSAYLALRDGHMRIDEKEAAERILEGYEEALVEGGRPIVLAEHHSALRMMATYRLHDPEQFWSKLAGLKPVRGPVPRRVQRLLSRTLPEPDLPHRIVHRVAGLGSLGRERYLALADWHGGHVAREAKALAPSACTWAEGARGSEIFYRDILDRSVRCEDPFMQVKRRWIVRRLAPDCTRIELAVLPKERDEARLLHAMGWETANVHVGSRSSRKQRADLRRRPAAWLADAAHRMAEVVEHDWTDWQKG
jgi:hypothetical protein